MFAGHIRICRQIQQLPKLATAGVRGNPLTYETGYGPLLGLADFFHVGNPRLILGRTRRLPDGSLAEYQTAVEQSATWVKDGCLTALNLL